MRRRNVLSGMLGMGILPLGNGVTFLHGARRPSPTLMLAGSTTMRLCITDMADHFRAARPDIRIIIEGGGSTPGLAAARRGAIDLALVSRHLTRAEDDEVTRAWLVGMDAIVLVVHPANPVTGLSAKQIEAVFEGAVTRWSSLGGADQPIAVIHRTSSTSTTRRGLEELVLGHADVTARARLADSHIDMIEAVAGDPNAIGYVALRDVGPRLRALAIDGTAVSRAAILTERYPYCRPFYLVGHADGSALAQAFVDYARGPEGQALMAANGLVQVG